MVKNEKLLEFALDCLKKGISVFPTGKDKTPLLNWKEFQSRYATEAEVRSWFDTYEDPQIGVVTGKISNLTVVDVEYNDPKTGKLGDPSFLPQNTMIVRTGGGGYHYYFLYDPEIRNKARIKELVDIRGEGGYVVSPFSVSSKGPYSILQNAPLVPFPKELFPKAIDIFSLPSTSHTFEKRELNSYQGAGAGQRNQEMAKYIGYVLTQIHPADWDSQGWNIVMGANNRNTPPLSLRELQVTFESIKRTERRANPLGRAMSQIEAQNSSPQILSDGSDEIKHIADVAAEQHIDQTDIYPLQMPCFDKVIMGGVSPGDLVVVAGQSGHGKTSLVQDWTLSLVRGEKKPKSLWFSYEVLPTHLWTKFQEMGMTREDCAFIPCKNTSGNVAWVEAKIKEGKEKFGIKMVMIDHLGFLLPKTSGILGSKMSPNYSSFLTQVVRDLKSIALKEEVIIFLPVHMRRAEKGSKRSDMDDIKDSSGIGQEADLVFLIERERDRDANAQSYFTSVTKITLAKNRKTGTTVIGNFSMFKGRFCYDDAKDKANEEFEKFGKEEAIKEAEQVQQPLVIPEKVEPKIVTEPVVLKEEDKIEGPWDNLEDYMEND